MSGRGVRKYGIIDHMSRTIPESTIEEIKNRIDLAELISSYGITVRRAGSDYKACCPFHHEKTPSFVIHPNQGYYHCFGCGEKGNVYSFVMKQEGLTFIEAVKKLAQQCGVAIEEKEDPEAGMRSRLYALHAELAAFFHRCLKQAPEAASAREYLASRRLGDEVAERFCIGYAPLAPENMVKWANKYKFSMDEMDAAGVLLKSKYENGRPYNRFGGRLMFTIRDRAGRPVAFSGRILTNDKKVAKYVNSPETLIFKKSNILFALDQAAGNIVKAPNREAIVCEGQIDVIRCHASGFTTAVASQGTAFTQEHVQILKKCADSVTLVFDADGAGQKAAIRTGGEFLAAEVPVRVATLPEGEDPDSLLRDQGPEAFQACLDKAESIIHFQIRTMRAKEERPDSIDAVSRVSKAALETLAQCPSAIMRASLVAEAAEMLKVPVAALEEDLAKVKAGGGRTRQSASLPSAAPSMPVPARPGRAASMRPPHVPGDNPRHGEGPVATQPAPQWEEPPEDFYIDVDPPEDLDREFDASAPVNNPPSKLELALCEFLFDHEGDASIGGSVAAYLPEAVLEHEFTRKFVGAWRSVLTGTLDAFGDLRGTLDSQSCRWLDAILLGQERAGLSEMTPEAILQTLLRRIWMAAVRRRQGELPAASTAENDARRLRFSQVARQIERWPWARVVELMDLKTLEG